MRLISRIFLAGAALGGLGAPARAEVLQVFWLAPAGNDRLAELRSIAVEPLGGNEGTALTIKAYQYDLVCNGYEIASGSIRNQSPELMVKAFELVGLSKQDVEDRFGGLYRAFQYGAPPHGGMAAGVDRIVMLLCGAQNLREITLFPMNQRAEDLLMGAPSPADPKQLRELHVRLVEPPKA